MCRYCLTCSAICTVSSTVCCSFAACLAGHLANVWSNAPVFSKVIQSCIVFEDLLGCCACFPLKSVAMWPWMQVMLLVIAKATHHAINTCCRNTSCNQHMLTHVHVVTCASDGTAPVSDNVSSRLSIDGMHVACCHAGGWVLSHAHLRWCQLQVATVRIAGKALQSHTEKPMSVPQCIVSWTLAASPSSCTVASDSLPNFGRDGHMHDELCVNIPHSRTVGHPQ